MAAKRLPLDPVADLKRRLARRSSRQLRSAVQRWWTDHGLAEHPAAVGKRIALALIAARDLRPAGSAAEGRRGLIEHELTLAGMLVLHELLADHLHASDLPAFERLFEAGHLAEGSVVDGFGVKVLGTMLHRVRGRGELARALAQWRGAATPWQRRAACVAFTALAPAGEAALPGLSQLIFGLCSTVVWSPDRLDQTAVGWLLRELSRAEPMRVEAFFRRHARLMSRECARTVVEKLPVPRQRELLAHYRRATTLRG